MSVAVRTLAEEFTRALHAALTPEVLIRNGKEDCRHICHSHDFCDASMVIHRVFLARDIDLSADGGMERWGHLWDAAWTMAKGDRFNPL